MLKVANGYIELIKPKLLLPLFFVLMSVGFYALFVFNSDVSASQTLTVSNTNDAGPGSLRAAIEAANSNGNPAEQDRITFSLPSQTEANVISLASDLPQITENVFIDGYSQNGSQKNSVASPQPLNGTILVEIKGNNAAQTTGLNIQASNTRISGLAIHSFEYNAKVDANNVTIDGNYLGLDASGFNSSSTLTVGSSLLGEDGCRDIQIGGIKPENRNIVSSNTGGSETVGVRLRCESGDIQGNYIGLLKDGKATKIGQTGIILGSNKIGVVDNTNIRVGGLTSNDRNVISGAAGSQIILFGGGNVIRGNYIGTDAEGAYSESISNGSGVTIQGVAEQNTIGGTKPEAGNTIRGVKGSGVMAIAYYNSSLKRMLNPKNVTILGNTISNVKPGIFYEEETGGLGVDLVQIVDTDNPPDYSPERIIDLGPNKNDVGDDDKGVNASINTPQITAASLSGDTLTVTYDLDVQGSPSNSYRLEFFANDEQSGYPNGPASELVGVKNGVAPGKNQKAVFKVNTSAQGKLLTATVTAEDTSLSSGFGATSEFAQNIVITNAEDRDGDGIPNTVEDGGPNGGDGNLDGKKDANQGRVLTLVGQNNIYITIEESNCTAARRASSLAAEVNEANQNYVFPFGLVSFRYQCNYQQTASFIVTYYTDTFDENMQLRMYSEYGVSKAFPAQNISKTTARGQSVIQVKYDVKEGADFDHDGQQNGVVVGLIGIAIETQRPQSGATTDQIIIYVSLVLFTLLAAFVIIFRKYFSIKDYKLHRDPLIAENPRLKYSYAHYICVVSWPQMKYRMTDSFHRLARKIIK